MLWPPCENGTGTFLPWLDRESGERTNVAKEKTEDGKWKIYRFARKDWIRGKSSSVGKLPTLWCILWYVYLGIRVQLLQLAQYKLGGPLDH